MVGEHFLLYTGVLRLCLMPVLASLVVVSYLCVPHISIANGSFPEVGGTQ